MNEWSSSSESESDSDIQDGDDIDDTSDIDDDDEECEPNYWKDEILLDDKRLSKLHELTR